MRHILLAAAALTLLSGGAYAQTSMAGSDSTSTAINTSGSQSSSTSNPKVNVIGNTVGNGISSSNSGAKASANTRSNSRSAAVGNTTTVNIGSGVFGGSGGLLGGDAAGLLSDPLGGGSAGAGTSGTGAGSGSGGGSGSSGGSGSGGGSGGGSTLNDPVYEQRLTYGGGYTVRNTPEVIAPSVVGGNACAVGASGGLSLPGFGLALGATWADRACERRQQAALLFNMGEQKVALELMCQDDNIRSAMKVSGKPCVADVAMAQAPGPASLPMAQAAPPVVKVAAAGPVLMAAAEPKPEWCARAAPATEASKAYVAQVCGK